MSSNMDMMSPMQPTTPEQPLPQVRGTTSHNQSLYLITGCLVMIGILALWYFQTKPATLPQPRLTPEEALQQLHDTSRPVSATPAARVKVLSELSKSSSKVTATEQQKLDVLEALSK